MDIWNLRGTQCKYLSEEQIRKIHLSSLRLLETTGCVFKNREALQIFEEAGATVDRKTGRVRIPPHLVEHAIEKAPSSVLLAARDKQCDITLEENRVYFGTGSVAVNVLDLATGKRRRAIKRDVYDFARLVDGLEYVHFYKIIVNPSDVPASIAERHMTEAAFNGTAKHFSVSAYSLAGAEDIIRMGEIVAGGSDNLRERPLLSINVLSLSPLQFDPQSIEILMAVARSGIPLIIAAEPQAGTTAPVTLAGAITLQNAESIAGIVLAQLVNPGTPVLCGSVGSIADMRTGQYASGAVELGIINAVAAQMAQYYRIPIYSTGGMSDSKIPDIQAGYEKGLQTLLVALSGANYIHDAAGLLEFCLTASYEQTVIDDEICGMVARALKGVSLDEEMIALDLIDEIGPGGHFLGELHTLKHFRQEQFLPEISNRQAREVWEEAGAKTTVQVAKEKAERILKEHFATPLDDDVKRELSRLVKHAGG